MITVGAEGAHWAEERSAGHVPEVAGVQAVDTTGAGDAFVGALAVELARGASLKQALTVGVRASYVFNGGPRPASAAGHTCVLHGVSRLGYGPNAISSGLRGGSTQTIGLLNSNRSNPFFGELAGALERYVNDHGYLVLAGRTYGYRPSEERPLAEGGEASQAALKHLLSRVHRVASIQSPRGRAQSRVRWHEAAVLATGHRVEQQLRSALRALRRELPRAPHRRPLCPFRRG